MGMSFADTIAGQTLDIDLSRNKKKQENLTTLCTDIFLIIIKMRESQNLGQPSSLRKLIIHYIDLFKKNCSTIKLEPEMVQNAVYALVALLDETVLSVPGECCNYWLNNPIQLEVFATSIAGEEFFNKLEKMVQEPQRMKDIIEIFYICLALGFEGKYRINGNFAERDVIIDKLARLLLKFGKHTFAGLSPHGRRANSGGTNHSFRLIPLWLITTLGALLLVGWWFAAHYVVMESLQQVLSALM